MASYQVTKAHTLYTKSCQADPTPGKKKREKKKNTCMAADRDFHIMSVMNSSYFAKFQPKTQRVMAS